MAGKTVVIIEDDDAIREGMVLLLERWNFDVKAYPHIEAFNQQPSHKVHLLFIDKQLPGTDGIEFCRMLKADSKTRSIPVVVMSASPHAAPLSKNAGADAFLSKPFSRTQLSNIIHQLLPESESSANNETNGLQ